MAGIQCFDSFRRISHGIKPHQQARRLLQHKAPRTLQHTRDKEPIPRNKFVQPDATAETKWLGRDSLHDSPTKDGDSRAVSGATHDQKFLPTPTDQDIGLPHEFCKALCNLLQQLVPHSVAVLVIHPLEEVDIDHNEHEKSTVPKRLVPSLVAS